MNIRMRDSNAGRRVGVSFSALSELVRHRRRRSRNLAELKTLDRDRLQDIGLTKEALARMIRQM